MFVGLNYLQCVLDVLYRETQSSSSSSFPPSQFLSKAPPHTCPCLSLFVFYERACELTSRQERRKEPQTELEGDEVFQQKKEEEIHFLKDRARAGED